MMIWIIYYGSDSNCDDILGAYTSKEKAILAVQQIYKDQCLDDGCIDCDCASIEENESLYSKCLSMKNVTNVGLYSVFPIKILQ